MQWVLPALIARNGISSNSESCSVQKISGTRSQDVSSSSLDKVPYSTTANRVYQFWFRIKSGYRVISHIIRTWYVFVAAPGSLRLVLTNHPSPVLQAVLNRKLE